MAKQDAQSMENVVFGGGGTHGFMYVGALLALFKGSPEAYQQWHRGLKSVAGTSIGALVGYLVTLWNPARILSFMKAQGFASVRKTLFDQDLVRIATAKSVNSGTELNRLLREGVMLSSGSEETTLAQLYKMTGITFVVAVTSSASGQTRFWSHVNMPDLPVWKAIRASVSIPFVFPEFEVGGVRYIDGGMTCNVPCHLFPAERTLVLYVQARRPAALTPITLIDLYMNAAQLGSFRVEPLYALNSIPCVPAADSVSPYSFGASGAELDALVMQGVRSWQAVVRRNKLMVLTVQLTQLLCRMGPSKPLSSLVEESEAAVVSGT